MQPTAASAAAPPQTGVDAPSSTAAGPGGSDGHRSPKTARPRTPWAALRSAPRLVWLVVLLHGLVLVCWSVLAPTYHAPDEPNHVDAAVRLYEGLGWPPPSRDVYLTPDGLSSWVASPYSRPGKPLVLNPSTIRQSDAVPRDQRVPWDQLREHYPPPKSNPLQLQQMVQHPPLYYGIDAAVLHLLPGADSMRWDLWVGVMRLVSVALATLLPLVLWAGAVVLTGDRTSGLVAALVPFAVPQLSHIMSVVNNDSAVIIFSSLAILGMACVMRGDASRRTAVFVGVSTGLALFSKSLSLVLVPMVVAAYALRPGALPGRAALASALREAVRPARLVRSPALLALVVAFVCGGWWYAFQLYRTGSVQPQIPEFPGGFRVSGRVEFFDNAWRLMIQRYWGSVGWYEVDIPFRYAVVATLLLVAALAVAVVRARSIRARLLLLLLLWPSVAITGLVVANSYGFYQHYGRVLGLQGRYLFLGVGGVALVLAAAVRLLPAAARRWTPIALAGIAAVLQLVMVRHVLRVFWVPSGGGLRQAWGGLSANAVWPPAAIQIVIAVAVVVLLVVLVELLLAVRRNRPQPVGGSA